MRIRILSTRWECGASFVALLQGRDKITLVGRATLGPAILIGKGCGPQSKAALAERRRPARGLLGAGSAEAAERVTRTVSSRSGANCSVSTVLLTSWEKNGIRSTYSISIRQVTYRHRLTGTVKTCQASPDLPAG
ncbi:hypothetical protein COCON_G00209950 [Conger conger]|uniref:Uncharacterized protein n=1 Tax=Conger conger TaxID=82655 RepID=A0A9Q1D0I5_CONCO|nr:hypothetical protein COCON_G00209950 [Conger conger]